MEQRRGIGMVPVGRYDPEMGLAADEYRFLADLLLDHIAAGEVWNDHLEQLVNRLFVLAVWTEGHPPKAG